MIIWKKNRYKVIGGLISNINEKIDSIVVTKMKKYNDWENIHIFAIDKLIYISMKKGK